MRHFKLIIILLFIDLLLVITWQVLKNISYPVAIVVPHHNLVKEKRTELFKEIAAKKRDIQTVVILSPDHFSLNQYHISYTDEPWHLSNGEMYFDPKIGDALVNGFSKETGTLREDHGIYNLLAEIKNLWPEAKIVPLLIGQKMKFDRLNDLRQRLNKYCLNDCLLVASVDFSHYLPRSLADIHDLNSLEALDNLKISEDGEIEIDSLQSLYLLTEFAKNKGSLNFHYYDHTNAGWLMKNRDVETTTHFFGWYQKDFFKTKKESFQTFLIGTNLNEKEKIKALGERFYYGVDYYNGQLKEIYQPNQKMKIVPVNNSSVIERKDGILNVSLGPDLVVSGYRINTGNGLVFLPIENVDGQNFLLRGDKKTKYLEELFKTVDTSQFIKFDKGEGTVLY